MPALRTTAERIATQANIVFASHDAFDAYSPVLCGSFSEAQGVFDEFKARGAMYIAWHSFGPDGWYVREQWKAPE